MYLLDTNIVSELRKSRRGFTHHRVAQWTSSIAREEQFLSVVTVEELEIGVMLMERRDPLQGAGLRSWFNDRVLPYFAGRVLPLTEAVALRCARLHVPYPRPIKDAQVAATALVYNLTLVTRNVADFERTGVSLLNPWESQ